MLLKTTSARQPADGRAAGCRDAGRPRAPRWTRGGPAEATVATVMEKLKYLPRWKAGASSRPRLERRVALARRTSSTDSRDRCDDHPRDPDLTAAGAVLRADLRTWTRRPRRSRSGATVVGLGTAESRQLGRSARRRAGCQRRRMRNRAHGNTTNLSFPNNILRSLPIPLGTRPGRAIATVRLTGNVLVYLRPLTSRSRPRRTRVPDSRSSRLRRSRRADEHAAASGPVGRPDPRPGTRSVSVLCTPDRHLRNGRDAQADGDPQIAGEATVLLSVQAKSLEAGAAAALNLVHRPERPALTVRTNSKGEILAGASGLRERHRLAFSRSGDRDQNGAIPDAAGDPHPRQPLSKQDTDRETR